VRQRAMRRYIGRAIARCARAMTRRARRDARRSRTIEAISGFGRILGFSNARERGKRGTRVERIERAVGWR
jgi:hypothetical protein